MPVCSIVRLLPLAAVDDLMHYRTWPTASWFDNFDSNNSNNSAPGRTWYLGVTVYSYYTPVCGIVITITLMCRGRPDALLHEAASRVQ